jgi:hypothetical protein
MPTNFFFGSSPARNAVFQYFKLQNMQADHQNPGRKLRPTRPMGRSWAGFFSRPNPWNAHVYSSSSPLPCREELDKSTRLCQPLLLWLRQAPRQAPLLRLRGRRRGEGEGIASACPPCHCAPSALLALTLCDRPSARQMHLRREGMYFFTSPLSSKVKCIWLLHVCVGD